MKGKKEIIFHYILEAYIEPATGVTKRRVIPEKGDSVEDLELAEAKMERALSRDRLRNHLAGMYKLKGSRDAMSAPIEAAMCDALDHEDVHSVWAALKAMAKRWQSEQTARPLYWDSQMMELQFVSTARLKLKYLHIYNLNRGWGDRESSHRHV